MDRTLTKYISEKLRNLWIEALEGQIEDENLSFFDNGGDSLGTTILLSRIQEEFDVLISLEEFFDNPTLSELEEIIAQRGLSGS